VVLVVVLVSPLPFVVPAWAIVTSFALSSGVGVVFGVSPAMRAAKLDPIVALRSA
jgi:putative ABC transport system permease protein